ncbi:LacI family DNA-binding transcriptional regulator [Solirubrobacter soli]|uniref:LacI family DNA-binding transcriptional regulator n=1 Tax=Solirubrobacter soli TaxID=363832 RepID=UPI0003F9D50A|nr:LacI family DNA-binding transcriptional regulator [Solirubrobacter soli]
MAKAKPTIVEVAADAGVSLGTASRALSGHPAVRDDTRKRVQASARRMGYVPNRMARSLRSGSSMLIGVIVPDIAHGFYGRATKAMQDVLEAAGYQILVMNTERQPKREQAALKSLLAHEVAGILMASSGGVSEAPSVPTVFFDSLEPGLGYANVAQANKEGMDVLVGHLADFHGYRRIAYLGAPAVLTSGVERLEGYRDAMGRRELPVPPELIVLSDGSWSPESGTAAMRDLLELAEHPQAVVAASDTLALGAIQAARDHGLRVPDDLAIVSFDDPFFGAFIEPQLTALMRDERELGRVAARQLLDALRDGAQPRSLEIRLPVELTIRRSCGCTPADSAGIAAQG